MLAVVREWHKFEDETVFDFMSTWDTEPEAIKACIEEVDYYVRLPECHTITKDVLTYTVWLSNKDVLIFSVQYIFKG